MPKPVDGLLYPDSYPVKAKDRWKAQMKALDVAMDHVTNWGVAIDGGAYVCKWSIAMAERFDRVHAFEPSEGNYALCIENLKDIDNVTLYDKALSNHEHLLRMSARGADILHKVTGSKKGKKYEAISIDSLYLDNVGLIKLDLEGNDLEGIQGALSTIDRCRPVLIVETKRDKEQIDQLMKDLDYRVVMEPFNIGGKMAPDTVYAP